MDVGRYGLVVTKAYGAWYSEVRRLAFARLVVPAFPSVGTMEAGQFTDVSRYDFALRAGGDIDSLSVVHRWRHGGAFSFLIPLLLRNLHPID